MPASLSFTVSESLLKLVHWIGDAFQPSHSLSSPSPPAFNLSQHQGLFQWVGFLRQWPKYWSFSFSLSPSNEHSGLIFFRIDGFDLLAVQGILKSLLQHHNLKASIFQQSAFFIVPMTTPKNEFDYYPFFIYVETEHRRILIVQPREHS